jgi:SAM-dependent methyltransferase
VISSDEHNLTFANGLRSVDEINGRFYAKFPFPWPPAAFDRILDPTLEARLLSQSIGGWDSCEMPPDGHIWVAGCGTNQAVITALKFPRATVIASDLSVSSLQIASNSARMLGLQNIEFRRQSINETDYVGQFDYIICTGVIHHNADPSAPLQKLRTALKRRGLCELMVYNRYHRTWPTAFQKAVQALTGQQSGSDFELGMDVTKRLMRENISSSMKVVMSRQREAPAAAIADLCMQPVEQSYTVESLEHLLNASAFEYCAPCVNEFDKSTGQFLWNLSLADPELSARYESLPDTVRWQVTNLLLLERSPLLWFYIQRADSGRARLTERELCEGFLSRSFRRVQASKTVYVRNEQQVYVTSGNVQSHPAVHPDMKCRSVLEAIDRNKEQNIGEVLSHLGLPRDFPFVNRLRSMLTTCAFPYLVCGDLQA